MPEENETKSFVFVVDDIADFSVKESLRKLFEQAERARKAHEE